MGLHWGVPALKTLLAPHVWDRLQSVHVEPSVPVKPMDYLAFLHGSTGELLTSMPVPNFYRLRRSKLRALMAEDMDVRFDKSLSDVSYSDDGQFVTAKFADGTSATGRFLVGADGARSVVRNLLLGPDIGQVKRLPYAATFVQTRFTAEQAVYLRSFHPLYLGCSHPGNYFAFFGMQAADVPDKPETWTFFFYISWVSSLEEQDATRDWTDPQRLQQVKNLSRDFVDPWKSAFEWTPDDTPVWHLGLTEWDPGAPGHQWDNHGGLVTLAGDAAHPMTVQRGQALNHAITDVGNLSKAIQDVLSPEDGAKATKSQADAISAYEKEMITRGGEEVRLCTKNSEMLHNWELVMKSPVMTAGLNKGLKLKDIAS